MVHMIETRTYGSVRSSLATLRHLVRNFFIFWLFSMFTLNTITMDVILKIKIN